MKEAVADHEILALYIDCFHKMFSHPSPKVAREAAHAARLFLNKKIPDHFAYEEQQLFPQLMQANPKAEAIELIATLRQEHRLLLKEAKRLHKLLLAEDVPYDRPVLLRTAMLDFFHRLERHASKENELLPSLL